MSKESIEFVEEKRYRAKNLREKGDLEAASILYKEIISNHTMDTILVDAYRNLGDIDFLQGRFRKAIENFEKALKIDPEFKHLVVHDTFYILGISYSNVEQLDTSVQYLERALESFEPDKGEIAIWQIYLALACILRVMPNQDVKKWMPYYHRVVEILNPFENTRKSWLSRCKGITIPKQIADALLEAYYHIGLFHLFKEEYREAIVSFTKGINLDSQKQPILAQTYFFLGRSYLHSGNNRTAIKTYQVLLKIDPEHQWFNIASIYYDLGQAYYKEGNFKQSLKYRLKILDLEQVELSLLIDVYLGLGHTYLALKLYEQAAKHYQKCIKFSNPKEPRRKVALEYLVYANEALAKEN